jgi:hypothetical protein
VLIITPRPIRNPAMTAFLLIILSILVIIYYV